MHQNNIDNLESIASFLDLSFIHIHELYIDARVYKSSYIYVLAGVLREAADRMITKTKALVETYKQECRDIEYGRKKSFTKDYIFVDYSIKECLKKLACIELFLEQFVDFQKELLKNKKLRESFEEHYSLPW